MTIQEYIERLFAAVNAGYVLDTTKTALEDQYHMGCYVYDAVHAVAGYADDDMVEVYITVRDRCGDTYTIVERYHEDGTREEVYMW